MAFVMAFVCYILIYTVYLFFFQNNKLADLSDEDAMSQIQKGHDTMCVVLKSRFKNLDTVRAVWTTGDIKVSVMSLDGNYCLHLFE